MANLFYRKPIIAGDSNTWGAYNDAFIKTAIGEYTSYLYNNGGVLTVSPGRIGINDGTNLGVAIIDTPTAITIAGTNGRWYKIEMTVSVTTVTFTSTVLADATAAILPATLTGSYVTTKQGFYHVSTARLIGVAWKDSTGVLGGIINCQNMINGYRGNVYLDSPTNEARMYYDWNYDSYRRWAEYTPSATWDMAAGVSKTVTPYLSTEWTKVKSIAATILRNDGTLLGVSNGQTGAGDSLLGAMDIQSIQIQLYTMTGGTFNAAAYNAAVYKVFVDMLM